MRFLQNKRLFISILLILLVACTAILPNNNLSISIYVDETPSIQVAEKTPSLLMLSDSFEEASIMLPKAQYKLHYNVNSDINSIFSIYETSKFVLALQLALQTLVLDRRKQIMK